MSKIWIGVDSLSPASDETKAGMRANLQAAWDARGGNGKSFNEKERLEEVLLNGEFKEVFRIDWIEA